MYECLIEGCTNLVSGKYCQFHKDQMAQTKLKTKKPFLKLGLVKTLQECPVCHEMKMFKNKYCSLKCYLKVAHANRPANFSKSPLNVRD